VLEGIFIPVKSKKAPFLNRCVSRGRTFQEHRSHYPRPVYPKQKDAAQLGGPAWEIANKPGIATTGKIAPQANNPDRSAHPK
jgi:hypothetical protein